MRIFADGVRTKAQLRYGPKISVQVAGQAS